MIKSRSIFFEYTLLCFLSAFLLILCFGGNFAYAVSDGIALWAAAVLPALFPYLFLTAILSSLSVTNKIHKFLSPLTTKLFNVGGVCGYALLISLFSGYPIGAKTVGELREQGAISSAESVRAAALCSSSSPMFILASVGNLMFNSPLFGILLYLSHIISVFIVGIIFSFYKRKEKPLNAPPTHKKSSDNLLYDGAYSAVISILIVGGLITVFYLLTEILSTLKILSPLTCVFTFIFGDEQVAKGLIYGLFECTKGLKTLSHGGITHLSLPVAAALCSFGGLSVIAQSIAFLKKAKIKAAPFLFAKVTQAAISAVIGVIFSLLFL